VGTGVVVGAGVGSGVRFGFNNPPGPIPVLIGARAVGVGFDSRSDVFEFYTKVTLGRRKLLRTSVEKNKS